MKHRDFKGTHLTGWLWGLNYLLHLKHFKQYLAHCKYMFTIIVQVIGLWYKLLYRWYNSLCALYLCGASREMWFESLAFSSNLRRNRIALCLQEKSHLLLFFSSTQTFPSLKHTSPPLPTSLSMFISKTSAQRGNEESSFYLERGRL